MSIRRSEYLRDADSLPKRSSGGRSWTSPKYFEDETSIHMMIATLAMSLCLVSGIGSTLRLQALRIQLGASRPRP